MIVYSRYLQGNQYLLVFLLLSGTAQCYYIPLAELEVNSSSGLLASGGLSKETWISALALLRISCILRLLPLPTRRSVVIGSLGVLLSSFLSVFSSAILVLLLPICCCIFGSLEGLLKQRFSIASLKDSSSSKDNLIWTRTKIIVGAIP